MIQHALEKYYVNIWVNNKSNILCQYTGESQIIFMIEVKYLCEHVNFFLINQFTFPCRYWGTWHIFLLVFLSLLLYISI